METPAKKIQLEVHLRCRTNAALAVFSR